MFGLPHKRTNSEDLSFSDESVSAFRSLIVNGFIEFHYQPIIDLRDLDCVGYEMLVRLAKRFDGRLPARQIVEMTRQAGADDVLLERALKIAISVLSKDMQCWPNTQLTINLTRSALCDREFSVRCAFLSSQADIPTQKITFDLAQAEFEINGTMLSTQIIDAKSKGFRFALDNTRNIQTCREIMEIAEFDEIKLDRSILIASRTDAQARQTIQQIASLCGECNAVLTVVGVETLSDWKRMLGLGANRIQGFFIDMPIVREDLPEWQDTWQREKFHSLLPGENYGETQR